MIVRLALAFLTVASSGCAHAGRPAPHGLVDPRAFDQFISEIERLDGQALKIRENRSISWRETVQSIRKEILNAQSTADLERAFRKLDLAYPSRHASYSFEHDGGVGLVPRVRFISEWIQSDKVQLRVSDIDRDFEIEPEIRPVAGDTVIAINGRAIKDWLEEGFAYCKFPLKLQCDVEFAENFRLQRFSWDQSQPLNYTLQRGSKVWILNVPLRTPRGGVTTDFGHDCAGEKNRYPGFKLKYLGSKACVYSSRKYPSTVILRISSFRYSDNDKIKSVSAEVDRLRLWLQRQRQIDHLIIDLSNNSGGDSSAPYFRLLVSKAFQGPSLIQFKKIPELDISQIRSRLFWESSQAEGWFQQLKTGGEWDKISWGEFLPPLPNFCSGRQNCKDGFIQPFPDPFKGKITIIVNSGCMSACDTFTYMAKSLLADRVSFVGQPSTAETGYGRLSVHLLKEPMNGSWTVVTAQGNDQPNPEWVSQVVITTKTVDSDGDLMDGFPVRIDTFVPSTISNRDTWIQDAVRASVR